jgi:hypothetical protein
VRRPANLILLALVVLCSLSLWLGRGPLREAGDGSAGRAAPSPEVAEPPADPAGAYRAAEAPLHLVVLNGTGRAGLAREVGLALGRRGCVAERTDNAPHDGFAASLLVNRRLSRGRARELAERLGGLPVLEERDPRTTEDAVLVLGTDWGRMAEALGLTAP